MIQEQKEDTMLLKEYANKLDEYKIKIASTQDVELLQSYSTTLSHMSGEIGGALWNPWAREEAVVVASRASQLASDAFEKENSLKYYNLKAHITVTPYLDAIKAAEEFASKIG